MLNNFIHPVRLFGVLLLVLVLVLSCLQDVEILIDVDRDGYSDIVDCDDTDPLRHPRADEVCDGIDNNCDGVVDEGYPLLTLFIDGDGDAYGAEPTEPSCVALSGTSVWSGDCDDDDPTVYPNAAEYCDRLDNDCNGLVDDNPYDRERFYMDADGDGYGRATQSGLFCRIPEGYVHNSMDCNDDMATVYPDADEICDGVDNDCDGLIDDMDSDIDLSTAISFYIDQDEDGYGDPMITVRSCVQPAGYVEKRDDCNDLNPDQNPAFMNDWCDGYDNDCDGLEDEDVKLDWPLITINDGYGGVVEIDATTGLIGNIQHSNTLSGFESLDVTSAGIAYGISSESPNRLLVFSACQSTITHAGVPSVNGRLACGLSFGPGGKLYALNSEDDSLYELSLVGVPTLIGSLGIDVGKNCGLAYDCKRDMLIGASSSTDELFTIDHTTGLPSDFLQTTVPLEESFGIEYDVSTDSVLLSTGFELYSVHVRSGNTNLVGTITGTEATQVTNLAFHPECP